MKVKGLFAALLAGCFMISLSSCDKDETGPVEEGSVNAELYFKGDLNGKTLLLPEGKDGYESQAVAYEPITVSGCTNWQAMRLAKGLDLKKSLEISFVKGTEACYTACAQVEAMYNTGTYSFGRVASGSNGGTTDGVIIRYVDVDGKVWSSDFGSGDQSGSSFR
ncbi:MAG: hypothetical protein LPK03_11425, partial [Pontibacter sp.]|nr:hypothetical protein [Pontibacter sp.]